MTKISLCMAVLCSLFLKLGGDDSALEFFDPGKYGDDLTKAPGKIVEINVDRNTPGVKIKKGFYGINIHPIPPREGFRKPELLKILRPEKIRFMVNRHVFWHREKEKSKAVYEILSPAPNVFNWKNIDAFLENIKLVGAEPYVSLGFGAPEYLNSAGRKRLYRPLKEDLPKFADYMFTIVKHMKEKGFDVPYVSIDNEPENVKYPIDEYIYFYKLISSRIRKQYPDIQIGGPATGYAYWVQPDGKKLSFISSLRYLVNHDIKYDAIDFHMYSSSPGRIFMVIKAIRNLCGKDQKIFLTEANLDWRYSNTGGGESRTKNTSWDSAVWLARLFDGLQQLEVDGVMYYNARDKIFGLYVLGGDVDELRPNYYVFYMFRNLLATQRVKAESSDIAVGVVATTDEKGKLAMLLYNRCKENVKVKIPAMIFKNAKIYILSQENYEKIKTIVDGKPTLIAPEKFTGLELIEVPQRGIVVIREE